MVKKALMIIAPQNFRDEELLESKEKLLGAGINVTVASRTIAEAKGMFGTKAKPDISLDAVRVDDYDAVIFVGGSGAETYFEDAKALSIARSAATKNKLVAAICIAPSILANAELLRGKRATVWSGDKYINILRNKGARYTGEAVTQDGKIITANGPESAKKFGDALVAALKA